MNTVIGDNAKAQLQSIIERIEALELGKKEISEDIKDVYAESKSNGYDTAALKEIIKLRKMDQNKREEREAIVGTYLKALGDFASTPLGKAAISKVA